MKRVLICLLAILLCVFSCACTSTREKTLSDTAFLLDTSITITLYGTDDETLLERCFDEIRRLENLLSATVEGSDVQRINANAGGEAVQVSEETYHVLLRSKELAACTGGAFDVTVGPLVNLWNQCRDIKCVPTDAQIAQARAYVGDVDLELSKGFVRLKRAGMSIDLGAIAKGYIGEQVKALLLDAGIEHALIDLGGNVLVLGGRPDGTSFKIGIQDPLLPTGTACAAIQVQDTSVVTAGDYERYFEVDGVRYHHILDPDTGAPARSGLSSATIVTQDSELADALSTAVLILGAEKGLELVESMDGVECILISTQGDILTSSGLDGAVTVFE